MTEKHSRPETASGIEPALIERWALIWCGKIKYQGIENAKEWAARTVPREAMEDMKKYIDYVKQFRSSDY